MMYVHLCIRNVTLAALSSSDHFVICRHADVIREKVHNVIKLDAVDIIAGEPADAMDTTA
jgi:hypothetical protein